ncbi:hypothetical protein SB775_30955 [Peribacillus sp. SIMBA_075]
MSEKLGVPLSTVRTRISRGKSKLRDSITRTGKGGDFYL